ncbi:MAG TPA: hypothetical protein VFC46_15255, partial [Humisphaera sp.]|nr:hypothetical protein [Humisphaera sp.]
MFGYWEPVDLVTLNDDILATIGSSWDDVRPLRKEFFSSDIAGQWLVRLRRVIEAEYADRDLFVIKDPRLARLMPLLSSTLLSMSIKPHVIIAVRHPIEVARSLSARDHFSPVYALLLWMRDILNAEANSRSIARSFLSYDGLLRDWREEFARVGSELAIEWPIAFDQAAAEISSFLRDDARHQRHGVNALADQPQISPLIAGLYQALNEASTGQVANVTAACNRAQEAAEQWIAMLDPFLPFIRRPDEVRLKSEGDSLLKEVERQIAQSTEVEANRHQQLVETQRQLSESVVTGLSRLEQTLASRDGEIDVLSREAKLANEQLEDARKSFAAREDQVNILTKQLTIASDTLSRADQEVSARSAQVEILSRGAAQVAERLSQAEHDVLTRDRRIQSLAEEIEDATQRLAQIQADKIASDLKVQALELGGAETAERLVQARHEVSARDQDIQALAQQTIEAAEQVARARSDVAVREEQISALTLQITMASEWLSRADREIAAGAAQVGKMSRDVERATEQLAHAEHEAVARDREIQELAKEAAAATERMARVQEEVVERQGRVDLLLDARHAFRRRSGFLGKLLD